MIAQLMGMGFPLEGCKKAVFHNPNSEACGEPWLARGALEYAWPDL